MNYLLDTNTCIALTRQEASAVRGRFEREIAGGARPGVSAIAVFELWCGVGKSVHKEANARRLSLLFGAPIDVIPFDGSDAQAAGGIRADLEPVGRPIGPYDILIAGQAIARDLILVTANQREFGRIQGLRWEDWSERA